MYGVVYAHIRHYMVEPGQLGMYGCSVAVWTF